MPRRGGSVEDERVPIEAVLGTLDEVVRALRSCLETVGGLLETAGEPALLPNYRGAQQQLQTALNAAAGAQRRLRRRLSLSRAGRSRTRVNTRA